VLGAVSHSVHIFIRITKDERSLVLTKWAGNRWRPNMVKVCTSTLPYILFTFIAVLIVLFGWGFSWYRRKRRSEPDDYDRNSIFLFFLILLAGVSLSLFISYALMEVITC
jgi:hypothetical protein